MRPTDLFVAQRLAGLERALLLGTVALGALALAGVESWAPRRTLLFAAALWVLSASCRLSLARGWGDPGRLGLIHFLTGAVLLGVHRWENPVDLRGAEAGVGWLGLWLALVPALVGAPRWAPLAGWILALAATGARALARGGLPGGGELAWCAAAPGACALIPLFAARAEGDAKCA